MDIALVFPGCHRRGGVERLIYEVARYFSRTHAVTVYAQQFEEHGLEGVRKRNVTTRSVPRAAHPFEFSRQVRKALVGTSHDHVVSFGAANVGADVLWVSSVHAAWLERRDAVAGDRIRSSPIRRYLPHHQALLAMERRYFSPGSDALAIVVARRVAEDIERLYAFPQERTVVVNNGFDPHEFNPTIAARERAACRAELGIEDDAVVALLVANELSRKGLPVLLEAVAALQDPKLHVLLVGRADPAGYARRLATLGLSDRFHYGGSRSDMVRIHGAADIFVLPTRYEAFCLAVVEALASGMPVITTDVPGAGDLVIDGVNGRLQRDPASSRELAVLLREALSGDRYKDWAANAENSVRNYTWDRVLEGALTAMEADEPAKHTDSLSL